MVGGSSSAPLVERDKETAGLGQREATAILGWRHSEVLHEKAPHRGDVAEPGSGTDVLDGEIGLLAETSWIVR
jgi:hypothetical protein